MKILIVEDSLSLVNVYQNIINNTVNKHTNEDVEIISIVNYNEYIYFKDMEFDLAIIDWNIIGGTSQQIIEESVDKIKHAVFITGYANNREVQKLSEKFSIPVMSKPTTDYEISTLLEKALVKIYDENNIMVIT